MSNADFPLILAPSSLAVTSRLVEDSQGQRSTHTPTGLKSPSLVVLVVAVVVTCMLVAGLVLKRNRKPSGEQVKRFAVKSGVLMRRFKSDWCNQGIDT